MTRFSAIIPARDIAQMVGAAIASIRAQSETVEIVVVDDASTDHTADAARRAGADVVVRLDANVGPAGARNRGVAASQGEIIGFCDADDRWTAGRLTAMAAALTDDVDLVVGYTRYVGLGSVERARHRFSGDDTVALLPSLGAMIVRRGALERVGPFQVELDAYEDYDWLLSASELDLSFAVVDEVVSEYWRRPGSVSQTSPPGSRELLELLKRSLDRRRARSTSAPRPPWGLSP